VDNQDSDGIASAAHKIWRCDETGIELQRGRNVSSYQLPAHFHEDYQFMLVETGAREISFRGDRRIFGGNYLTIVNPGETHSTGCHGECGSSFKTMHLPAAVWTKSSNELGIPATDPLFPFEVENSYVLRTFARLHEAVAGEGNTLRSAELLTEFIDVLVSSCRLRRRRRGEAKGDDRRLNLVRHYIEDNYAQNVTLEELADLAGLSKFHLLRSFSQFAGMPPHAFQTRLRLNRAKKLLSQGKPLKQVAAAVGFADASHFGKHFLRIIGFTPKFYQQAVAAGAGRPQSEQEGSPSEPLDL
jgi:AraC-like DNA-binding protein